MKLEVVEAVNGFVVTKSDGSVVVVEEEIDNAATHQKLLCVLLDLLKFKPTPFQRGLCIDFVKPKESP